jgi:hypothetical protein
MASSSCLDALASDGEEVIKAIGIVGQDMVERGDLSRQLDRPEPEVEDTGVRLPLAEDQLTAVPVKRDDDALLAMGDCQNLGVLKGWA